MKKFLSTIAVLMAICLVTACSLEGIPNVQPDLPELPEIPDKPQIPEKEIEYFADEAELLSFIEEHFVYSVEYDYDDVIVEDAVPIMPMPEASMPSVTPMAPTAPVPTPAPSAPDPSPSPVAPAPMEPSAGDTSKNENVSFPTDDSAESDDVSSTNVQVEGIDEGDILKTDGKYIYIIQNHVFTIIDITKDVPEKVASVNLNTDNNSLYINEMYIKGDKAILLCNESVREENRYTSADTGVDDPTGTYVPMPYIYYTYKNYTTVLVYDISDRSFPTEERKLSFEGSLISSREMNGKLYLVTNKYFYSWSAVPTVDVILPEVIDSEFGICTPQPTDIARCIWTQPQSNIMTIAIIDYLSQEQPETLHMMGSGSRIYMNAQNLYIFNNGWEDNGSYTEIAKYSITDGIKSIGTAKAPGYASTQFSFDEYNGKFRIATTANVYNGEKYEDMNNIYVFDEAMTLCGSLTGLAPTENIKSARFMGDIAYLVTFRQVDPLFVIDMSENDPKVLGELKIPGFSTYLHPVGDGLLLGIGSETVDNVYGDWVSTSVSGLKVSLFDVSDPCNPLEVDVESYVGGKNAYSVAKDNHNAFVYSASTNTGYFPLTTYDDMWTNTDTLAEVKIENNQLDVRVADLEKIYDYYSESRVCYAGDYIYLFRNCALTKINRDTLEFICEINGITS